MDTSILLCVLDRKAIVDQNLPRVKDRQLIVAIARVYHLHFGAYIKFD